MDNKRLVVVLVIGLAVFAGWMFLSQEIQRRHPEWYPKPQQTAKDSEVEQRTGPAGTQPTTGASTAPAGNLRVQGGSGDVGLARLGNDGFDPDGKSPYPIGLALSPRGASVESATLNRFRAAVGEDRPFVYQQPYEVSGISEELRRSLATRSITVNGAWQDLAKTAWAQKAATENSVTYSVDLASSSGEPLLSVDKSYYLKPAKSDSQGYEVVVTYTFQNRSNAPAQVKTTFNGPNVPPVEGTRDLPEIVAGYNDDGQLTLEHHVGSSLTPEKPALDLKHSKGLPLLWAGITSAYWNAIVRPELVDGKTPSLSSVTVQAVAAVSEHGQEYLAMTFETADFTVPAGGQVSVPFYVYFGPRQRAVLNSGYYEAFPLSYDRTLVLTGGLCGFCTFQWLINVLVWMLKGFYVIFRDWGLAIIGLVLVVRLLLHPITKKSQVNMAKMSKMGPEMERLKKKHGDNKDELNKAMMQFYKEQGFTPILGCLPMFLQMPIWIALWSALQSTFELRQAPFLWGFTWIQDLSQPDRLIYFPKHPIPLYFTSIDSINLLPVLLAVVFWFQQKMTPKPPTSTPEQEQQQKMMQWMTLLFPLLLYTGPSGLNLYILTSTAIGIWESKIVRDHIKAQEEAETAGKVIVDAPATRASRRRARDEQRVEEPKRGIGGLFARLQQRVEDIRREAERKDKGKR